MRVRLLPILALFVLTGLSAVGCGSDDGDGDVAATKQGSAQSCGIAPQPKLPDKQKLDPVPIGEKIDADLPQLHAEISIAARSVAFMPSIGTGATRLTIGSAEFAVVQLQFENRGARPVAPAEVFLDRLVLQTPDRSVWGTPTDCSGLLSAVADEMRLDAPNERVAPGKTSLTFWVFGIPRKENSALVVRYTGKYVSLGSR
jgi:hypothetical protein